jgi:hypothetical protein
MEGTGREGKEREREREVKEEEKSKVREKGKRNEGAGVKGESLRVKRIQRQITTKTILRQ